jgi:hypothetical protein
MILRLSILLYVLLSLVLPSTPLPRLNLRNPVFRVGWTAPERLQVLAHTAGSIIEISALTALPLAFPAWLIEGTSKPSIRCGC